MKNDKTTPTPVSGYLAQNWFGLNEQTPAVILNPAAQPLDLMAWCWGELASLQAAADALTAGTDNISRGDFSALFVHRLDPLMKVFDIALHQLRERALENDRVCKGAKLCAVPAPGSTS